MSNKTPRLVSAHTDGDENALEYDIIPLDISEAGERAAHDDGVLVVSQNGEQRGKESQAGDKDGDLPDFLSLNDVEEKKKVEDESIVKSLLEDHEKQGFIVPAKKQETAAASSPALLKTVPWKKCLYINSPTLRLHQEILHFCSCLKPTPEEEKSRKDALKRIEDAVKAMWPKARVEVFGSFATGLYLPTSDMDAVILDSACSDIRQGLKVLGKSLSSKGIAVDLQIILKARVPIIKFQDKESGYQFDISFDVANGPEAAQNVRELGQWIPAMSALVMVLKVFLQQRELNEVYSGGIGSYALLVMVANFIQTHWSRFSKNDGDLGTNLGELLLDFFRLHGRALKQEVVGVSCSTGGKFFRKRSLLFHYPERPELPAVQDPNDKDNDLGKNSYNASRVRMAFDNAYTRLSAKAKPGESMLARIIRLDAVLLSRYKGDDVVDDLVGEPTIRTGDSQGKNRATVKKKRKGAGRQPNSKGPSSKNRKKTISHGKNKNNKSSSGS